MTAAMTRPPTDPEPADSPLAAALSRVGDRWSLLLVEALLAGPARFGELAGQVRGIAPNILADRLRRLERAGVILGEPYSRRPLRLAYRLTEDGRDLAGVLRLLGAWAVPSGQADGPRHGACGTPVDVRWYCPTCARTVEGPMDADIRRL
jgi:DNA-binding HxlR family transcriptional regulator